MTQLLELLAAELERPRELSPRVLSYIEGTYSIEHESVGVFLLEQLQKLEDYEIDLILSPLFTPKLADQAVFAEALGSEGVPKEKWPGLVQQLASRPTRAQLMTLDGRPHPLVLREVTLERYVYRLRLDGTIPESLVKLFDPVVPASDRPTVLAISRRAVWERESVRRILARYLTSVAARGGYGLGDTIDLLNLVETRKPSGLDDFKARLPGWQKALREQVESGSGSRPFFSEDVRMMHGGDRDQRQADPRMSGKEKELDFLVRLEQILSA